MCTESIIKAASTFISHAKSWFLLILAKALSVLKVHLMYPWALKAFALTDLVAPWSAQLKLYRRMRYSDPNWRFLLTVFQKGKWGFNRMKHLLQLLLPTVSCWVYLLPAHTLSLRRKSSLSFKNFLNPEAFQISQDSSPCLLLHWHLSHLSHRKTLQQHLLLTKATQGKNNYLYF